jgi:hypothetical protein
MLCVYNWTGKANVSFLSCAKRWVFDALEKCVPVDENRKIYGEKMPVLNKTVPNITRAEVETTESLLLLVRLIIKLANVLLY